MDIYCLAILLSLATLISGHGYLIKPPARNSIWRVIMDKSIKKNYNDNELFCGGATKMAQNGGRCGVCGDPWGTKNQPHMDGGIYDSGIIGQWYKTGQTIEVQVQLTQSHKGYFEFRIGDFTGKQTSGNEIGKLNGYLLRRVTGETKFPITKQGNQLYKINLILPPQLTCQRCVLQWWYRGGNNWGDAAQEHFVNCADVTIE